jgi:hypothetical protein
MRIYFSGTYSTYKNYIYIYTKSQKYICFYIHFLYNTSHKLHYVKWKKNMWWSVCARYVYGILYLVYTTVVCTFYFCMWYMYEFDYIYNICIPCYILVGSWLANSFQYTIWIWLNTVNYHRIRYERFFIISLKILQLLRQQRLWV